MSAELRLSIVVVGRMNPAIHHPSWYQAIGVVDAATAQTAVRQPDLVLLPQLARVRLGPLSVQCLPDQWNVAAATEKDEDAAYNLACVVFEALDHTPVDGFGVNYTVQQPLDASTPKLLGQHLARTPFGQKVNESDAEFESLTVGYALEPLREVDGCSATRRFRSQIGVITTPRHVLNILINVHHEIRIRGFEYGHFSLSRLLRDATSVRPLVKSYVDDLLRRIAP